MESFYCLVVVYDLVIVEGVGSLVEINLCVCDIVNMGFVCVVDVFVCMIGDIDKGGVIVSLVGIKVVLCEDDVVMIKGFLINKFCGDLVLFDEGVCMIE